MSVPNVSVTDLSAGLAGLSQGVLYDVPEQPYSAVYIPEAGSMDICLPGKPMMRVEPGGLCCLPRGHAHQLSLADTATSTRRPLSPPFSRHAGDQAEVTVFAARVPTTSNPLPDIVPPVILLSPAQMQAESQLDLVFRLIRDNTLRPNDDRTHITHRLAEVAAIIMLEHVLRRMKREGLNTVSGVGDPQIRRALLAIHEAPAANWTLEALARHAGLSRSVFAERFRGLVENTPMEYVTRIRMARATHMLRTGNLSISEIAYQSGYRSDASFHKAFKRMIGMNPKAYRLEQENVQTL